jgi:hypothetical protein
MAERHGPAAPRVRGGRPAFGHAAAHRAASKCYAGGRTRRPSRRIPAPGARDPMRIAPRAPAAYFLPEPGTIAAISFLNAGSFAIAFQRAITSL